VTAPSIYAAFGDKKRLFLEAMRRYAGEPDDLEKAFAIAPTAPSGGYKQGSYGGQFHMIFESDITP